MKTRTVFTALAFLILSAFSIKSEKEEGIVFFDGTWKEAIKKAQSENKYIFLDAYATWCGPCKQMSKTVFTDKELGFFFNENFICIKVDMESKEGKEVMKKFPVRAYPTLLYIDPSGKEAYRLLGLQTAEKLISVAKHILGGE